MGNFKMNCGYCGRKCSLDKDFCIPQDSVYICKSCYEWQNKVSNLEAKLAESEKKREELDFAFEMETNSHKEGIEFFSKQVKSIQKENKKLKQQLQEEKNRNKKLNHEAQKYYEDAYCNGSQNQTAIAELERLKEEFNGAFSISIQQEIFDKYIDQQIKSLKGEGK
jgi:hypothetical protein